MEHVSGSSIGREVLRIRTERNLSQVAVAQLAGFSKGYLSLIENGQRPVKNRATIEALAGALRVSPSELTGTPYAPSDEVTRQAHAAINSIRRALAEIELTDPAEVNVRPLPEVMADLDRLNALRQACDFAALGHLVPDLVRDLHARTQQPSGVGRRQALIGLIDCYEAARAAAKHLGVPDLAQVAARHVRDAADALGGAEWHGLAVWSRAQAIGSTARERVLSLSRRGADELSPELDRPEVAEVYGSLHLVAALSATTIGRFSEAAEHLAEAEDVAARTKATNFAHLYFGRGNVAVWRVMTAVESGEGGKASEIASSVPSDELPRSGERLSNLWLDVARGIAPDRKRRPQAVTALRKAEELAPQKIRNNPFAREIVGDLVRRAQRDAVGRELRGMAYRMGIAS